MAKRIAILISGRGSNMVALADGAADPELGAKIVLVLSNRPEAGGLAHAQERGIATATVDHTAFDDRAGFEAEIQAELEARNVEIVCLAGFMRLLTADFVERWRDRLINIHPSLLPAYPGVAIHERVIHDGVRISGCTVHFVRPEMDLGPIIAQAAVPVLPEDTAETLSKRVLACEHRIYPRALGLVCGGRVRVVSERVVFADRETESAPLFVPPLRGNTR